MPFPLLSSLADLDSSLQAADAQVVRLGAGMEFNEQLLSQAIVDACGHARSLTDLIQAERPSAQWSDRASLEALILELKAADDTRRNQQRSARLLDLASELEAGRVQHRLDTRSNALNTLRSQAADQLRARAALPEQEEELPGPNIAAWLPWAFNLQDDSDADVLAYLRTNFAVLERFTGEMDESYWVAAPRPDRASESSARAPADTRQASKVAAPAVPASAANQRTRTDAVKQNAAATPSGDIPHVLATVSEPPKPVTSDDSRPSAITAQSQSPAATTTAETKQAKRKNRWRATAPTPEPTVAVLAQADAEPAAKASAEAVITKAVEREEAPVAEAAIEAPAARSEETQHPSDDGQASLASLLASLRKQPVLAWGGLATCVVLLSGLFLLIIYHLNSHPSSKPGPTVEAATNAAADGSPAAADVTVGDASLSRSASPNAATTSTSLAATTPQGPTLHRQPAEGAQESILLSLENCGRGKPDGIECWGYVSNLGGAASHVSLDRVDVVDGHGNSFSLEHNGQFVFPNGPTSNVPAGSRVKYIVKVPDKDADARTLTLYMDLSNPRSLEYTFRDIPVAQ